MSAVSCKMVSDGKHLLFGHRRIQRGRFGGEDGVDIRYRVWLLVVVVRGSALELRDGRGWGGGGGHDDFLAVSRKGSSGMFLTVCRDAAGGGDEGSYRFL